MRFYADATTYREAADVLAGLRGDVARAKGGRGVAIHAWRDALIAAGMLEQALADRGAEPGHALTALAALTDRCARGLAASWQGHATRHDAEPELALAESVQADLGRIEMSEPEGYLFYGLYPECYLWVGQMLGALFAPTPVVVIGIRSIGTSLGAAVAAGMHAQGCAVERHSVRPTGPPFARELSVDVVAAAAWRAAAARGAHFVAVDEGPGLSGSSLASVVLALERLGIESEHIRIVYDRPGALPMAGPETRAVWQRVRGHAASAVRLDFWQRILPRLLSLSQSTRLRYEADLSWGAWAQAVPGMSGSPEARPLLPELERRKLLLRAGERLIRAKFVGFGAIGRQKGEAAQTLSRAGLTPPYLGCAHGMVLHESVQGRRCAPEPGNAASHIEAAARYYAFLRSRCLAADDSSPSIEELAATTNAIAQDWFGAPVPGDASRLSAGLDQRLRRPIQGDARPEPVEWIDAGGVVLKSDAADHFLDHSWARCQDICFDLAGFILSFSLHPHQQQALMARYSELSGDDEALARLPFFRAVYAAHRLAMLDTGFHAAAECRRGALDRARRQMAETLGRALAANGSLPVRVIVTADAVGGVWQYATTLVDTLAEQHGVQVLLVVCGPRPDEQSLAALRPGTRSRGGSIEVECLEVPLEWQGGSEQAYSEARRTLLHLALTWRASIVHVNEHYLGELGSSGLPVLMVSHSDLCSWQAAVRPDAPPAVDEAYMRRVRVGLEHSSLVVAPSSFVAQSLNRWYNYGGVIRVLPNGVTEGSGGLTPARTIDALMAGRLWDPAKNLPCFQQAAAGFSHGKFVAAGPLRQRDNEPGDPPAGNIEYPGALPHLELRDLMTRSRILVSPARYDPFGLVAAEAAMAGCCLLLADIPSYRSLWGSAARYFPPEEPAALAKLLDEMLIDVESQKRIGLEVQTRARALYSAERMASAYLTSYQRLALRYGLSP